MESPNSRLGFHYFLDDTQYTEGALSAWVPVLRSHHAKWLVVRATPGNLVPEFFVGRLIEAGIQPIVWIHSPTNTVRAKALASDFNSYADWGVRDVVVFDRPNMRECWSSNEWSRVGLVDRFVDRLLPVLQLQRAIGLHPVFPPLEPGGDYWDTAFLETAFQSLIRRGHHDLLREMRIALYAWTYGRPLEWGAGGGERWADSLPYHLPAGSEDQRGFSIFDWYAAVSERTAGLALPMLAVSGGALHGGSPNLKVYKDQTLNLLKAIAEDQLPQEVYAFCVYPLVVQDSDPEFAYAWYAAPDRPRPVALSAHRRFPAVAKQPELAVRKPIDHYWLVTEDTKDMSQVSLMAQVDQAVIGFSSAQAALAKKVTLVGPVPASIERKLRRAGAEVSRVRIPESNPDQPHAEAPNIEA